MVSTFNQKCNGRKEILTENIYIYCGRDRITLTDELDLCDDGNITSNKDKLLKIGKLLGVESKTCNDILNQGWNMANR